MKKSQRKKSAFSLTKPEKEGKGLGRPPNVVTVHSQRKKLQPPNGHENTGGEVRHQKKEEISIERGIKKMSEGGKKKTSDRRATLPNFTTAGTRRSEKKVQREKIDFGSPETSALNGAARPEPYKAGKKSPEKGEEGANQFEVSTPLWTCNQVGRFLKDSRSSMESFRQRRRPAVTLSTRRVRNDPEKF